MVNSAWFFSTLAQATAAIVGLVVSLSAIQYQLERQRRERRTEDLRDATRSFEEKYEGIISTLAGEFAGTADKSYIDKSWNVTLPGDELNLDIVLSSYEPILNMSLDAPVATLYWSHLSRVSNILIFGVNPSSDPKSHYLFSDIHFDRLRESTEWLDTHLDGRSDFTESLYDDLGITGNSRHTTDVFRSDHPGQSVQDWLQEHQALASEQTELLSGENVQSYRRVAGELYRDFRNLDSLRENTILTFNPNINNILYKSILLLLVGVFLPMTSLVTNMEDIFAVGGTILLSVYELTLLAATFWILLSLLNELQSEFGGATFKESVWSDIQDRFRTYISYMRNKTG